MTQHAVSSEIRGVNFLTQRAVSTQIGSVNIISVASQLQILMDHLLQLLGPYGGTCVVYIYLGVDLQCRVKERSLSCEKVLPGCAWLVLSKTAQACI